MISTASSEELLYNKFLCQDSTLNFTRYFFKHQHNRKFIIGEHHQKICQALDDIIAGKTKKLIINIAPRYGKTELAVKNFIAYGLAINPASRFIHLSYSDDLALDNSESVKDIVNLPEYQQLFSNVQIKKGSDSKKKWYTTSGGGVYATAAAGQVTGFGAGKVDLEESDFDFIESQTEFAGALIIDDPIKPEDADSILIRNRINQRWDSTIKNRVNSRNTPIIIIMQRLHEDDLCGYLIGQSKDDWSILSFPCLRDDNTALWPFKHTVEELQKLQRENEMVFSRQYQQDPKPLEGILFKKSELNYFTRAQFRAETYRPGKKDKDSEKADKDSGKAPIETVLGYIDPAEGGGDPLAFLASQIIPGKVFVTDVVYSNETVEKSIPKCVQLAKDLDMNYVKVEKNGLGSGFIRDMRREFSPEKILSVSNATHKGTRIWNEYAFIIKYFYFLAESEYMPGSDYDKFMRNLFSYMKVGDNQEDGAPDASAGLSRFIQANPQTKSLFQ